MTDAKLIANLFDRLNQNQLAFGAAVDELSSWSSSADQQILPTTCAARWKRSTTT